MVDKLWGRGLKLVMRHIHIIHPVCRWGFTRRHSWIRIHRTGVPHYQWGVSTDVFPCYPLFGHHSRSIGDRVWGGRWSSPWPSISLALIIPLLTIIKKIPATPPDSSAVSIAWRVHPFTLLGSRLCFSGGGDPHITVIQSLPQSATRHWKWSRTVFFSVLFLGL